MFEIAVISQPGMARTPPMTNEVPKNKRSTLALIEYSGCVTKPNAAKLRHAAPTRMRPNRPKKRGR